MTKFLVAIDFYAKKLCVFTRLFYWVFAIGKVKFDRVLDKWCLKRLIYGEIKDGWFVPYPTQAINYSI